MAAPLRSSDDLRRRILDASLSLISEEGLEAFSMREVARRAGVSHQAPYHHFSDREAILAAIVAEGFTALRAQTQAAALAEPDALKRLSAVGRAYLGFALAQPAHFKLMFRSEWVRAEHHDDARACAEGAFQVLAETIAGLARERGSDVDPALLLLSWSVAHGLATLMLEGKLKVACGEDEAAHRAAADAVFAHYEALLAGHREQR